MTRAIRWAAALLCTALAAADTALAQGYPSRPVRVIQLTAAGGSLDIMARMLAQSLSETMGQQFYIENKLGAGGNLGVAELARARADGYTIGMITAATHGINPSLYGNGKLPFDPLGDFEFLAVTAEMRNVVVIHPSVPAHGMQELVRHAKANPGKISFGSPGVGTSQHMAGELFKLRAGIDITHVAYRGVAQAAPDLVSGQIQLMFSTIPNVLDFIRNGQLRAIGVTTSTRSPVLPDAAPVAEQGFPGYDVKGWVGFAVPKGTPPDIVVELNRQIVAALARPDLKDRLAKIGMDTPEPRSSEQTRDFVKREIDQWSEVVKAANIQPPQ
ncbi:MAG: tripartite tricarboxylate transporter substrate binding protein [Xanthobacteraceae bacterium]|nr:tripartite tricarboxylate transporter substrate binding protein [Xanthobacteraceae bacterium]